MMTQSSGRQALAALRVGWIRTFSAAGSDEPYFVVSRGDSDSGRLLLYGPQHWLISHLRLTVTVFWPVCF